MRFLLLALLAGTASAATLTFTVGDPAIVDTHGALPANAMGSGGVFPGGLLASASVFANGTVTPVRVDVAGFLTITGGNGAGTIISLEQIGDCGNGLFPAQLVGNCNATAGFSQTFTFGAPLPAHAMVFISTTAFPFGSASISIRTPEILEILDSSGNSIDASINFSGTNQTEVASPEPSGTCASIALVFGLIFLRKTEAASDR